MFDDSGSFNTIAPSASEHDIQTNAISASSSTDAKKEETSQWSQGSIPWTLEKLGLNTLNDLLVLSGLDEMFDKEGEKSSIFSFEIPCRQTHTYPDSNLHICKNDCLDPCDSIT